MLQAKITTNRLNTWKRLKNNMVKQIKSSLIGCKKLLMRFWFLSLKRHSLFKSYMIQFSIQNRMNKGFIFCVVLLLGVAYGDTAIRVTCQAANTSICASGFQFTLVGTNLSTKYCLPLGQNCTVGSFDTNLTLKNCTVDYKNNNCTTNVCYTTVIDQPYCASDFANCNATSNNYSFNCAVCTTIANCPQCLIGFKDGLQNGAETCLGSTCGTIINTNITVQTCTSDSLGFQCGCCVTAEQEVSICTSQNPALSLSEVTSWARQINNNQTSPNFEWNIKFLGVLVLLVIAIMI